MRIHQVFAIFAIFAIIILIVLLTESRNKAMEYNDCIKKLSVNSDYATVDLEDVNICILAYEKNTSKEYEIIRAIKRPIIDRPQLEL